MLAYIYYATSYRVIIAYNSRGERGSADAEIIVPSAENAELLEVPSLKSKIGHITFHISLSLSPLFHFI